MLREEVREVVDGAHVWDDDLSFLDDFADVEVAARDVLRALVEFRVVGEVVRRLVSERTFSIWWFTPFTLDVDI